MSDIVKVAPKAQTQTQWMDALNMETIEGFRCLECDEIAETCLDEPLYECGNCGKKFTRSNSYADNHQCPDCYRFGSKLADQACTECEEGDVEEVELVRCFCGDLLDPENVDEHLLSDHPEEVLDALKATFGES